MQLLMKWTRALHRTRAAAHAMARKASAISVATVFVAAGVLAAAASVAVPAAAAEERIALPPIAGEAPERLDAALYRAGSAPAPLVVALHGCGGLRNSKGDLSRRHADWAERLNRLGYSVLFPDSFASRGVTSQCKAKDRVARASRERVDDVRRALAWAAAQPFVDSRAIHLLGWSNGGSTVLSAVQPGRGLASGAPDFASAVAFYPGCRVAAASARWRTRVDLLILIGEADDWTPAAPCEALATAHADRVSIRTYPGAYHEFDHPGIAIHERRGLAFSGNGTGVAHLGTDPAARADVVERVPAFFAVHRR